MFFKRKRSIQQEDRPVKDTLIIIGNGFDIWQGLGTSYTEFQNYYLAHRDEILKKLRIKKKAIHCEDGQMIHISDVELIYSDPFDPGELAPEFWHAFEVSLDDLDDERINLYFGKNRRGLREMERSIHNAHRILQEAFCGWIATISIDERDSGYRFGDNCLFINFNYTDTLQKRFGVRDWEVHHIHGEASDKESIVVGHSNHPEQPEKMLYRLGGRFRGLYFVEWVRYETDKHVRDNIGVLCMFLALSGARVEGIRDVYVVGHSMAPPDLEYFQFLTRATRVHDPEEMETDIPEETEKHDPLEQLHLRLQYVIGHGGGSRENDQVEQEQIEAVSRKFELEQAERTQLMEKEFFRIFGKGRRRKFRKEVKKAKIPEVIPRTEDAMWHISYYSDRDKLWAEKVMESFRHTNFRLYPAIDECLKPFRQDEST